MSKPRKKKKTAPRSTKRSSGKTSGSKGVAERGGGGMNLNRALRECEDLHGCVFSGVSNDCNDPAAWIEAFGKYERQILRLQERNLTDVLFEKAAKIAYGCPAAMVRILEVWPDAGSENKAGSSALQACERLYCKAAETLLGMARDSRIEVDTSQFLDALKCVHRFCRETEPETALNVLSRHVLFRPRLAGASRGGKPPERMPASGRETVDAMATVNRAIAGIDPERSLQPDIARLAEQAGDLITTNPPALPVRIEKVLPFRAWK